jgi:GntR family phosphonate transport system transcriptional regulator
MTSLVLDHGSGEALYLQIRRLLEREIQEFRRPGDLLPSEAELAERFGVNRHTLRRAIDHLIAQGLVERRHGRGSVVLDRPIAYGLNAGSRFTETLESLGHRAESRLLRKLAIPAQGGVARRLDLAPGASVAWIETLRLVDDRPFCVISHFLPTARVPAFLETYAGGSLHQHLRDAHGISVLRRESFVSAALPQGEDASLLAMPRHQPVLRVKSLNVDLRDGAPVEYCLTRFRADCMQLHVQP